MAENSTFKPLHLWKGWTYYSFSFTFNVLNVTLFKQPYYVAIIYTVRTGHFGLIFSHYCGLLLSADTAHKNIQEPIKFRDFNSL